MIKIVLELTYHIIVNIGCIVVLVCIGAYIGYLFDKFLSRKEA